MHMQPRRSKRLLKQPRTVNLGTEYVREALRSLIREQAISQDTGHVPYSIHWAQELLLRDSNEMLYVTGLSDITTLDEPTARRSF